MVVGDSRYVLENIGGAYYRRLLKDVDDGCPSKDYSVDDNLNSEENNKMVLNDNIDDRELLYNDGKCYVMMEMPKVFHGKIIGEKGKRLKKLEIETGTKITFPPLVKLFNKDDENNISIYMIYFNQLGKHKDVNDILLRTIDKWKSHGFPKTSPKSLELKNIDIMNDDVMAVKIVYATVQSFHIQMLSNLIVEAFHGTKYIYKKNKEFYQHKIDTTPQSAEEIALVKLHCTIMNTNFNKKKFSTSSINLKRIMETLSDFRFGNFDLNEMNSFSSSHVCPRLVDYIIIVGCRHPSAKGAAAQPPELLRRYPLIDHKDFVLPADVIFFCQPEGCINIDVDCIEATGKIQRRMKQLSSNQLRDSNFVFALTEKDTAKTRYGICYNFYRYIRSGEQQQQQQQQISSGKNQSNSINENKNSSGNHQSEVIKTGTNARQRREQSIKNRMTDDESELSIDKNNSASLGTEKRFERKSSTNRSKRHRRGIKSLTTICLLSHYPFFTKFSYIVDLLRRIFDATDEHAKGRLRNDYSHENSNPKFNSRNAVWSVLTGQVEDVNTLSPIVMSQLSDVESWILRLLMAPVPLAGQTKLHMELLQIEQQLQFALPDKTRFPLIDFPLHLPLELLGIDLSIKVFTIILLEQKIIFQSRDYNTLSKSVMAFVAMLYPLEYMFPVIPLLPVCMSGAEQLLLAPTPFIIGVPASFFLYKRYFVLPDDVWLLDIDSAKLIKPMTADNIPDLPQPEGDILRLHLQQALNALTSSPKPISAMKNGNDNSFFSNKNNESNCSALTNPLSYGTDVDSVDIATRVAMVRFFNSPNVLGNFNDHTRTLRLFPRPVVAFQHNSFLRSRPTKCPFILRLAKSQAIEYFAEVFLNPVNVAFQRIFTGVIDPSLIGDKSKWYSRNCKTLKFSVATNEQLLLSSSSSSITLAMKNQLLLVDNDGSPAESTSFSPVDDGKKMVDYLNDLELKTEEMKLKSSISESTENAAKSPYHIQDELYSINDNSMNSILTTTLSKTQNSSTTPKTSSRKNNDRSLNSQSSMMNDSANDLEFNDTNILSKTRPDMYPKEQLLTKCVEYSDYEAPKRVKRIKSSKIHHRSSPGENEELLNPTHDHDEDDEALLTSDSSSSHQSTISDSTSSKNSDNDQVLFQQTIQSSPETFLNKNRERILSTSGQQQSQQPSFSPLANGSNPNFMKKSPNQSLSTNEQSSSMIPSTSLMKKNISIDDMNVIYNKLNNEKKSNVSSLEQQEKQFNENKAISNLTLNQQEKHTTNPFDTKQTSPVKQLQQQQKQKYLDINKQQQQQQQSKSVIALIGDDLADVMKNASNGAKATFQDWISLRKNEPKTLPSDRIDSPQLLRIQQKHGTTEDDVPNKKISISRSSSKNLLDEDHGDIQRKHSMEIQSATHSDNQLFLKEVVISVLKGEGVPWLKITRTKRLMEDENYRNFILSHLNTSLNRRLKHADEHIDDVLISKEVYKGTVKLCQLIIHGLERTYANNGLGGMASAFQLLELAHTHFWQKIEKASSQNINSTVPSTTMNSLSGNNDKKSFNNLTTSMISDNSSISSTINSSRIKNSNISYNYTMSMNYGLPTAKSNISSGYRYRYGTILTTSVSPDKFYVFENLLTNRSHLWDSMQFWEDAFLDAVAQERDMIGMDQGPGEMMDRYLTLKLAEKKRLELDEDQLLTVFLYNLIAFMIMMKVNREDIRRKVRRLLGKCHIGLVLSQQINELSDHISQLNGNDVDLKPANSRLISKSSFAAHLGTDNSGELMFMEVCDDCIIIRSVLGEIKERWWYEKLVNMTFCPKTKVLCLWTNVDGETELSKFYTRKQSKDLYFSIKDAMENAAIRMQEKIPGQELGGNFKITDLESKENGIVEICLEGLQFNYPTFSEFIELSRIKKCTTKKGNIFVIEVLDIISGELYEKEYYSIAFQDIALKLHRIFSIVFQHNNSRKHNRPQIMKRNSILLPRKLGDTPSITLITTSMNVPYCDDQGDYNGENENSAALGEAEASLERRPSTLLELSSNFE
ncbi:hypothetical protein SNEBB_002320 [Seison nebaliae]|nr:hypothetical protein SNEBB_002320 [Seison nebaliae]